MLVCLCIFIYLINIRVCVCVCVCVFVCVCVVCVQITQSCRLADDLGLAAADAPSLFTGEDEVFAFRRTVSRLAEMQTQPYWDACAAARRHH